MDNGKASVEEGTVVCASCIKRPENAHLVLVVIGKSNLSSLEIFSFHPKTTSLSPSPKAKYAFEVECEPVNIEVHPSGDIVFSLLPLVVSQHSCTAFLRKKAVSTFFRQKQSLPTVMDLNAALC